LALLNPQQSLEFVTSRLRERVGDQSAKCGATWAVNIISIAALRQNNFGIATCDNHPNSVFFVNAP
jgi:hypothetical protein